MVQWSWNYGLESNLSDIQPCGLGPSSDFLPVQGGSNNNLPTKSIGQSHSERILDFSTYN